MLTSGASPSHLFLFVLFSLSLWSTVVRRADGHVLDLHVYNSTSNFAQESKQSIRILDSLRSSRNFTLEARINFSPRTQKVLVAIKSGKGAFFLAGIEIRPLKNQLVVHYYQKGEKKRILSYYRLDANVDHYLTITFDDDDASAGAALVHVNCTRIYSFSTGRGGVDRQLPANRWLTAGAISVGKGSQFRRATIADIRLYNDSFPSGIDHDCLKRMSDSEYFRNQAKSMNKMKNELIASMNNITLLQRELLDSSNQIKTLSNAVQVKTAELSLWDGCQCLKHCYIEGKLRQNGSMWTAADKICTCLNGEVSCTCRVKSCSAGFSLLPVKGRDCRRCFRNCVHLGQQIVLNTSKIVQFGNIDQNCTCTIENVQCKDVPAPTPQEPSFVQPQIKHNCSLCDPKAECNDTGCYCNVGYKGNGFNCTDSNECLERADVRSVCSALYNKRCVNTLGSYRCECLPGFFARSKSQARCLKRAG